ncbi:MAG: sodium/solute symporter [Candidatus Marinimicrobia bacterium]|nr:sodium/solute symporter [Candidatus Neomarinimicrobiota bacterium]
MNYLDWSIIIFYTAGLLFLSYRLGKTQFSKKDYYLGGNRIHWLPVSISTMATQLSTNSLLGAPAFVAFSLGGGLLWLQYELAVPLAMIFIMIFLVPFFKKTGVISIYEFLELRLGVGSRTLLSILFQFIVAFGTGVTIYGISLVLQTVLGIPFWTAVLLLGVVTVIYDTLAGIKGVIVSDVIQMIILVIGIFIVSYYAVNLSGGIINVFNTFPADRLKALNFTGHGLGDNATFSFLPMLFGGFFLYVSYYGCNQTQVQRQLATRNINDTKKSLFANGILRFPVVLGYMFLGITISAYAITHSDFLGLLPTREVLINGAIEHVPNYNTAVPAFVLHYLPHGIIGLIIVALFSAAMSSLDSTLNSLSATTVQDVIGKFSKKKNRTAREELILSKLVTLFWGIVIVTFSFFVGGISDSIIVSINKIGSLANGSILGAFILAIFTRRANDRGTVVGVLSGFIVNLLLWKFVPSVSWLWWNVIGCLITVGTGYIISLIFKVKTVKNIDGYIWNKTTRNEYSFSHRQWRIRYIILIGYFLFMLLMMSLIK